MLASVALGKPRRRQISERHLRLSTLPMSPQLRTGGARPALLEDYDYYEWLYSLGTTDDAGDWRSDL